MPSNSLRPGAAGGQNQDRHMPPGDPPASQHGKAVHCRQAEIENDEIIGLGVAAKPGVLAIGGSLDDVARAG